ncbi:uncharacterized protein LOC112058624 [Bicyclus anynana]|uniref:Uncharacterized protein LOC112058624 n=1 Tax=Bicyclus anynana TaxID=110368 RepID=A0A6J1PC14_BICAN|nr:uncharacterized protein LOC112058624 [Bicyclus anynana]
MHSFNGTRQRRNLLDINGFAPIHFPLTSYSTNPGTETKEEMKHTYGGDTLFFNNLHLIPDPLKKNLADSVITGEENKKRNMFETKTTERPQRPHRPDYYPSIAGITSFFSGVMNVMGAIFQKRTSTPPSQYYDCFENYNEQQMAPPAWQTSNIEVQNKNEREPFNFASNNEVNTNLETEMNTDCRISAKHCEDKLNQVQLLLSKKNQINEQPSKYQLNRPRKAFIEAGSVEESFEDAFCPEDFATLANDTIIEFYSPYNCHNEVFSQANAPKLKTEICKESTDTTNSLPVENKEIENLDEKPVINDSPFVNTDEVVSSCEDKLSKLKALLQRGKKVVNTEPEVTQKHPEVSNPIPLPDWKPENPNDVSDTVFGTEINSAELHSSQDSDYFNEVTGKFFASSLESDDSFQIVFSDSPRNCRRRIPSECDSEDSFIVFEESPDNCYTSHDVFGEEIDVNHSDSDSEVEEDSSITCKIAHNLSRTFGDLTDDSLYSQDVVDSVQVCDKTSNNNLLEPDSRSVIEDNRRSLLLSEKKKSDKRKLPPKKVTFSSQPPKVHVMRVWAFAARQARAGEWERHALDRERFKRRIADVEMAISWVFKRQHRTRIVFQRFRPWWNAERRRELAEKKEKEERDKERKKEEENVEHNGEGNVVKETEDAKEKDIVIDSNVNSIETTEQGADLNGFVGKNDVGSDETIQCNENNSNPCNESGNLNNTDRRDAELPKPVETISNTAIVQNGPKNGIKESVAIAYNLNNTQDILIRDGSVDT